jgi:hypothetical protein
MSDRFLTDATSGRMEQNALAAFHAAQLKKQDVRRDVVVGEGRRVLECHVVGHLVDEVRVDRQVFRPGAVLWQANDPFAHLSIKCEELVVVPGNRLGEHIHLVSGRVRAQFDHFAGAFKAWYERKLWQVFPHALANHEIEKVHAATSKQAIQIKVAKRGSRLQGLPGPHAHHNLTIGQFRHRQLGGLDKLWTCKAVEHNGTRLARKARLHLVLVPFRVHCVSNKVVYATATLDVLNV